MPEPATTDAWRTALKKASASEEPCAFTTGFEMPSRAVPPTLDALILSFRPYRSFFSSSAAALFFPLAVRISFSSPMMKPAAPSMPLSRMFPLYPSHTTTSHTPRITSLASTLPMKLIFPSSCSCRSWG